ncbi:SIMPL domain-containing protein [Salaquimonas pukyongi]|uniref:SIMPL domain-containing protein n=1 Tax=Salaquimonas pukyongi TaxID=2712698 RepID=UPI00096BADC2|nr:SIMPL domain-containing protein [Salaquimonas pukyongi]
MNNSLLSRTTLALAATLVLAPAMLPTAYAPLQLGGSAWAEEKPVPQISIVGEASVDVAPDLAILDLGVLREGKTAREALSANNLAMSEVLDAMKQAGIEARDLQTSNFAIHPKYVHHRPKDGEEQKPPRIVGYRVTNTLTVRIRDLEKTGEILDRAVTLGVNTGGSIRFANDDPKSEIAKARAAAMKDAIARAKTLLEAAGAKLGPILSISENYNTPRPVPMARGKMMAEAAMADSVPIEGGENTYSVTVSVSWKIVQ